MTVGLVIDGHTLAISHLAVTAGARSSRRRRGPGVLADLWQSRAPAWTSTSSTSRPLHNCERSGAALPSSSAAKSSGGSPGRLQSRGRLPSGHRLGQRVTRRTLRRPTMVETLHHLKAYRGHLPTTEPLPSRSASEGRDACLEPEEESCRNCRSMRLVAAVLPQRCVASTRDGRRATRVFAIPPIHAASKNSSPSCGSPARASTVAGSAASGAPACASTSSPARPGVGTCRAQPRAVLRRAAAQAGARRLRSAPLATHTPSRSRAKASR
jgi:hypothetical protein